MNTTDFPNYLAFGKLNVQSIRTHNHSKTADYELLGEKIMELTISPNRVEITEYLHDESLGYSCYPRLQDCFLSHFRAFPIAQSGIMKELISRVCSLGNVFFEYPHFKEGGMQIVFYPAASLQAILLPITSRNKAAFLDFIESDENMKLLNRFYETSLLVKYRNQPAAVNEEIFIAEFIVPLAFVYERVALLSNLGLILSDKLYRGIIQDSYTLLNSGFRFFYGRDSDLWNYYGIEIKSLKSETVNNKPSDNKV